MLSVCGGELRWKNYKTMFSNHLIAVNTNKWINLSEQELKSIIIGNCISNLNYARNKILERPYILLFEL